MEEYPQLFETLVKRTADTKVRVGIGGAERQRVAAPCLRLGVCTRLTLLHAPLHTRSTCASRHWAVPSSCWDSARRSDSVRRLRMT